MSRHRILSACLGAAFLLGGCSEKEAQGEPIEPEKAAATATEAEGAKAEAPAAVQAEAPVEATPTARVGQPAPAFELKDQAGKAHQLADYKGKVVVLEWFCPTCPYVERHYEAKTMTRTADSFPDGEVVWLAVDSSHFVEADKAEAWREEHGVGYPILLDPTGAVGKKYEARTTPHMFDIDREGVLRYAGAIDDDPRGRKDDATNYVKAAVDAVLAGKEVPKAQTEPYGCTVKYGQS